MKTVYKYPIPIMDDFEIKIHRVIKILHVDVQDEQPCIWALVESDSPLSFRQFSLRGTGHSCDGLELTGLQKNCDYVGTFIMQNGAFVFHLFDLGDKATFDQ